MKTLTLDIDSIDITVKENHFNVTYYFEGDNGATSQQITKRFLKEFVVNNELNAYEMANADCSDIDQGYADVSTWLTEPANYTRAIVELLKSELV